MLLENTNNWVKYLNRRLSMIKLISQINEQYIIMSFHAGRKYSNSFWKEAEEMKKLVPQLKKWGTRYTLRVFALFA